MDWKICTADDIQRLSDLNGLLHEDEGAIPMPAAARADRLRKWMDAEYTAVLFSTDGQTAGYALYRPTDPDSEGLNPGVFIRQYFVVREQRRRGVGRQMFDILTKNVWPPNCGILLDTEFDNERAQAFWRSLGFSENHLSFIRRSSSDNT